MMTEEQKKQVRGQVNAAAAQGAQKAAEAAKKASGWKKWALIALATLLAGVAVFTQTQCSRVTPEQVHRAHGVYHALTGTDCVFELPVDNAKK